MRATRPDYSGQRTLLGNAWTTRKAGRSGSDLRHDHDVADPLGHAAADLLGSAGDCIEVGARPEVEHNGDTLLDQRQAPLHRNRRRGERARKGDYVTVCYLLGAAPEHA